LRAGSNGFFNIKKRRDEGNENEVFLRAAGSSVEELIWGCVDAIMPGEKRAAQPAFSLPLYTPGASPECPPAGGQPMRDLVVR